MSYAVDFQLDGFDELEKQLAHLELSVQKNVLRQTVREAADPIRKQMLSNYQSRWNHDTGQLAESFAVRVTIPRNPTFADVVASVGVFKNRSVQVATGKSIDAPVYAYWLEYGTRAHSLATGASLRQYSTGKKKRIKKRIDRPHQWEGNQHPGFAAKPFIRPAFDSHLQQALDIQKSTLSEAIDKALSQA